MGISKQVCGGALVLAVQIALVLGQRIEIDTWEDLTSISGWMVECNQGYQRNVADFLCNRLTVPIPPGDLNGEVGFWTGCGRECKLTYRLRSTDVGFGFRAYLKNMHMIVRKNDLVDEHISGDNWVEAFVDLSFTTSISLRLTQLTSDSFVLLDKIYIQPEVPTTIPPPTNSTTTTAPPTNSTTTTAPPSNSTTTTAPPTNSTTTTAPPTNSTTTTAPPTNSTTTTAPPTNSTTTTAPPTNSTTTTAPPTNSTTTTAPPTNSTTTTAPPTNGTTTTTSPTNSTTTTAPPTNSTTTTVPPRGLEINYYW